MDSRRNERRILRVRIDEKLLNRILEEVRSKPFQYPNISVLVRIAIDQLLCEKHKDEDFTIESILRTGQTTESKRKDTEGNT